MGILIDFVTQAYISQDMQELLGHASLSTTQRYTDINADALITIYKKSYPCAYNSLKNSRCMFYIDACLLRIFCVASVMLPSFYQPWENKDE